MASIAKSEEDKAEPADLSNFLTQFESFPISDRKKALDSLFGLCGSEEKWHLQQTLPSFLFRDFFELLPPEVLEKVLKYLDCKTLLKACCVSKLWNDKVSCLSSVWQDKARNFGVVPSYFQKNHSYDAKVLLLYSGFLFRQ